VLLVDPVEMESVEVDVPVVLDVLWLASAVAATPETSPTVTAPAAAAVATAATTALV
jgi:hypothetical protein